MKNKKVALITGITGQDGSYLTELLLEKGYNVWGLIRRSSTEPLERIWDLKKDINLRYGNMSDYSSIKGILEECKPDEVYNLAAQSDVGISFKCPDETKEVNYHGLGRLVDAIQEIGLNPRIYQASTSEMFGNVRGRINEKTPFSPQSPYAKAKLKAHLDFVVNYRERCGMFICSGFLFNHESPRRGEHFVTRKITQSMAKIKLGLQESFSLGNLDSKRDWGYSKDYVEAMWLMLQQEKPRDYVIATGEQHSVREFVEATASELEMDIKWRGKGLKEVCLYNGKKIITVNPQYFRPKEVHALLGDASKARRELKWKPKVSFNGLVKLMAESDLEKEKVKRKGL